MRNNTCIIQQMVHHHMYARIKCRFLFITFVWVEFVRLLLLSVGKEFEHVIVMLQFALLANCTFSVCSSKWYEKVES